MMRYLIALLVAALQLVGCGDSSSSTGAPSTPPTECAITTGLLCDRAAACTGSGKAIVSTPGATAEHANVTDCKNYYQAMQCSSAQVDWTACKTAVQAASCATTTQGSSIALPTECKGLTL